MRTTHSIMEKVPSHIMALVTTLNTNNAVLENYKLEAGDYFCIDLYTDRGLYINKTHANKR